MTLTRIIAPIAIAAIGCFSAIAVMVVATARPLTGCEFNDLIALASTLGTGGLTGAAGAISLAEKTKEEEKN